MDEFIKEDTFLDKKTLNAKNFMMSIIPKDKYIDLYHVSTIKHILDDIICLYLLLNR